MQVKYVAREMLGPDFGIAHAEDQVVFLREDFSPSATEYPKALTSLLNVTIIVTKRGMKR